MTHFLKITALTIVLLSLSGATTLALGEPTAATLSLAQAFKDFAENQNPIKYHLEIYNSNGGQIFPHPVAALTPKVLKRVVQKIESGAIVPPPPNEWNQKQIYEIFHESIRQDLASGFDRDFIGLYLELLSIANHVHERDKLKLERFDRQAILDGMAVVLANYAANQLSPKEIWSRLPENAREAFKRYKLFSREGGVKNSIWQQWHLIDSAPFGTDVYTAVPKNKLPVSPNGRYVEFLMKGGYKHPDVIEELKMAVEFGNNKTLQQFNPMDLKRVLIAASHPRTYRAAQLKDSLSYHHRNYPNPVFISLQEAEDIQQAVFAFLKKISSKPRAVSAPASVNGCQGPLKKPGSQK